MTDVFISYSRQNTDFVRRLYEALDRSGRDVWIDWESIPRGEEFLKTIYDGIDAADVFLCVISRHSLASEICNLEVRHARRRNKKILPIVLEMLQGEDLNAVIAGWYKKSWETDARDNWETLKAINWAIFTPDRDFDTEFKALTAEIETDRPHVRLHTRYGVAAKDWQTAGRNPSLLLIGDQVSAAEAWLKDATTQGKIPAPTDEMRLYIAESRHAEDERARIAAAQKRRTRQLTASTALFVIATALLAIVGVTALQSREASIAEANIARTAEAEAVDQQNTAVAAQQTALRDADIARTAEAQAVEQQDIARAAAAANLDLLEHREPSALERVNQLVAQYPQNASAYFFRALVLSSLDQSIQAIADYDTAIELDPTVPEAYNNRGLARFRSGDTAGAEADFDAAIRLNPDYAEAYSNRGAARVENGDYADAIVDYDTAIRLNPSNVEAYFNRGSARAAMGDPEGALADFDTAIRLNPAYELAYYNRANTYAARGDYAAAIADYDAAIRLNPLRAEAYNNRGTARDRSGDPVGALEDLDTAVRLDPNYTDAYFNRGNTRANSGDQAGAIEDYTDSIRLRSDNPDAYYNRALSKFALEDYVGALDDFDAAIRLNPNHPQLYSDRGLTHFLIAQGLDDLDNQLAEAQAAVDDWNHAEQLGLTLNPDIAFARDQLSGVLPPTPTATP
ncbi:MAG: tetratricopeptide repeat protein [Anaerolineae bacterium]